MKITGLCPAMLNKSRFNRGLHYLSDFLFRLFFQPGQHLKTIAGASDYVIDSFPVAVCDNIRISRCRLLQAEQWRGEHSSIRRYFYDVKVQVSLLPAAYRQNFALCQVVKAMYRL